MIVILDPGHGIETPGKRSPDSSLLEYKWNREIADRVSKELDKLGIKNLKTCIDEKDVPLKSRVDFINKIYKDCKGQCVLVSIHVNAGLKWEWHNANGWEVHIYREASSKSKDLAQIFLKNAKVLLKDFVMRNAGNPIPGNLYMVKNPLCPAVLTENLVMTNKRETEYLLSEEGKQTITKLHVDSIKEYVEKYS